MNKEQKKFKKIMKQRARCRKKMNLLKIERESTASKINSSIVEFRKERKKVAEQNTEKIINRRKQLIKLLKLSDEEAKNYSNGALDGLYEEAMRRSRSSKK